MVGHLDSHAFTCNSIRLLQNIWRESKKIFMASCAETIEYCQYIVYWSLLLQGIFFFNAIQLPLCHNVKPRSKIAFKMFFEKTNNKGVQKIPKLFKKFIKVIKCHTFFKLLILCHKKVKHKS
jgi:hypothetical protein